MRLRACRRENRSQVRSSNGLSTWQETTAYRSPMVGADSRRAPVALLVAVAALPRLAVLLHERGQITSAFVDKGSDFARTFVASGTYGFIPGHPSAYTQPLYGFFLVPLYWIFGRSWVVVGLAQIAVAAATAVVVYELGRRFVSQRAGLVAALVATLEPYLIWHDVHMNREILDQLLAAALVLLTLSLAARPSIARGLALGAVAGLAVLGNVRLLFLPLIVAAFALVCARRAALVPAVAVVLAAVIVVLPWTIRNQVSVGCFTVTTDSRALLARSYAAQARRRRSVGSGRPRAAPAGRRSAARSRGRPGRRAGGSQSGSHRRRTAPRAAPRRRGRRPSRRPARASRRRRRTPP